MGTSLSTARDAACRAAYLGVVSMLEICGPGWAPSGTAKGPSPSAVCVQKRPGRDEGSLLIGGHHSLDVLSRIATVTKLKLVSNGRALRATHFTEHMPFETENERLLLYLCLPGHFLSSDPVSHKENTCQRQLYERVERRYKFMREL